MRQRRRSAARADRRKLSVSRKPGGQRDPSPPAMRSRWAVRRARRGGFLRGQVLCLSGQKRLVVGLRLDVDETAHAVMTEAAQLRAGDFVVADSIGNEPDRNVEAGNGVLLHAHFVETEAVDDV